MRFVPALALLALLIAAAPAAAELRATGTLSRNADGTITLSVTNTSTAGEGIDSIELALPAGYTPSSPTPAPPCSITPGSRVLCSSISPRIPAGGTFAVTFSVSPVLPDNAGGTLTVYDDASSITPSASFPVTGPTTPPGVPSPTTTPTTTVALGLTPIVGSTTLLEPVAGTVFVRTRGKRRFEPLGQARLVPNGSELDTRRGTARVTVAKSADLLESVLVSLGRARVSQDRTGSLTTLRLSQPLTGCRAVRGSARAAARRRRGARSRRIFADGKGSFQTRGSNAAGAVRGTAWVTADGCASTRIGVRAGTVAVRDFRRRRTVNVTAGRSYRAVRRRAR